MSHTKLRIFIDQKCQFSSCKKRDFCDFQEFVIVLRIVLWDFTVNNGKLMYLVHTNKHSNFLMFICSNVHLIFMCKNKISIHTHGFYLFRQTLPHHITTYLFLFIHNLKYFPHTLGFMNYFYGRVFAYIINIF